MTNLWWAQLTQPNPRPHDPLAPTRLTLHGWRGICQRIGGCVTNRQLDEQRCIYCGGKTA